MSDRVYDNRADFERDRALHYWNVIYNDDRTAPNNSVHYLHKMIDVYADDIADVECDLRNIGGTFSDLADVDRDTVAELLTLRNEYVMAEHMKDFANRLRAVADRIDQLVINEDICVLVDDLRAALDNRDNTAPANDEAVDAEDEAVD